MPGRNGGQGSQNANELESSFASELSSEFPEVDRFLSGNLAINNDDPILESLRVEFQSGRNLQAPSVDDAWAHFTSGVGADSKVIRNANAPSNTRSRSYFFAFTLVVFLAAGAFFKGAFWNSREADSGKMEYVTAVGQQVTVTLDDGTVVKLAPDTRLRYTYDNIRSRRDVYLNGEAYFDVVTDNKSPFTVFAGNTSTQVLGTSFGVRNYQGDSVTHVYVESGRVAFSGVGILNAGDVASLTESGKSTLLNSREIALFRSWTDGVLIIQTERFGDVISRLERWYGISINVADPNINNIHLTAVFRGKSMSNLVAVLAGALEARVQEEGSVLTLSSW